MTDRAEVGAGDVAITIDGESHVLKPTLECCMKLSRINGGFFGPGSLSERLQRYDWDVYPLIIRAGLGLGDGAVKGLDEQIYRAGMISLIGDLSKFIGILANGGKPAAPQGGDEEKGKGSNAA